MSYNNQTDFTGSTQSNLEMENVPELVSNCCRAYPRLEVNGVEWNDEDNGICPTCGDHCEYVEEDREYIMHERAEAGDFAASGGI